MVININPGVFRQTVASIAVGLIGVVCTLCLSYSSPAIPSMKEDKDFQVNDEQISWIASVVPGLGLVGSVVAGPLVETFGRQSLLLFTCLPFALSWSVIAMAGSVEGVILGRMIAGICVGIQTVSSSVFFSEIISLRMRGRIGAIPALLASSGQEHKAYTVLLAIRGSTEEARKELEELKALIGSGKNENVRLTELIRRPNLWPVSMSVFLMIVQQLTGINGVVFYASQIFESTGSGIDPGTCSVLMGIVSFVSTIVGVWLIATTDRRILLHFSSLFLIFTLLVLSLFTWMQQAGGAMQSIATNLSFVPVIFLLNFIFIFALGWGPVPWIFIGEGLPSKARGLAAGVSVTVNWAFAFLVTKSFMWGVKMFGFHVVFLIMAGLVAIGQLIVHFYLPETRDKSFAEMENLYKSVVKEKVN